MPGEITIRFFGVGPQRTASSWLYEILARHPTVFFPKGVKETMFFDQRYHKGIDWYLWHFAEATSEHICGEIAPTYFDSPEAVQRIHTHFPDAKIIVTIRNPIEQSYSLFRHHLSKGRVVNDFNAAVHSVPNILTAANYRRHIPLWESSFGRRMLFVFQEDVRTQPASVIGQICEFLEIVPVETPQLLQQEVNSVQQMPRSRRIARLLSSTATILRGMRLHRLVTAGKRLGLSSFYQGGQSTPPLSSATFERLLGHFESDIEWVEQTFQRDCSAWRKWAPNHTESETKPKP